MKNRYKYLNLVSLYDNMKILSFDCATRTLGYCLLEYRAVELFANFAQESAAALQACRLGPEEYNNSAVGIGDNLVLYKVWTCGVIDVTAGRLMRNVSLNRRRRLLVAALDKLMAEVTCINGHIDIVLLEDQPAKLNKGSRLVQEQIAMYFTMALGRPLGYNVPALTAGPKIKTIKPWRKLQCNFAEVLLGPRHIIVGKKDKVRAYAANKRRSVDVFARALSRGIVGAGPALLFKWPASVRDDIADAFLQAVAWAEEYGSLAL
jgi:hypothetical protein